MSKQRSPLFYRLSKQSFITVFFSLFCYCLLLNDSLANNNPNHQFSNNLPDLGSTADAIISVRQEQLIADQIQQYFRSNSALLEDPEIEAYITELGYRLIAKYPNATGRTFYFSVVNENSINASAFIGGFIIVHSGLILAAQDESELASVLAHEIVHVTQRHHARFYQQQQDMSIPQLLALFAGILVASKSDGDAGAAIMMASQGISQQNLINYTRANEQESDRIGMQLLAKANFDPYGMVRFFDTMQKQYGYNKFPLPYLLSHPLSSQRVSESRILAAQHQSTYVSDTKRFLLIKAKLKHLLSKFSKNTLEDLQQQLQKSPDDEVLKYQTALALQQAHQYAEASKLLQKLYEADSANLSYLLAYADSLNKQKIFSASNKVLQTALSIYPGNRAIIHAYANNLTEQQDFNSARTLLLSSDHIFANTPWYYQLLSQINHELGNMAEFHENNGQYLFLIGDLQSAINQFKSALASKESNDPNARRRINARINKAKDMILELRTKQR